MAGRGVAWFGEVRQGEDFVSVVAWSGNARRGKAWLGRAWLGAAWLGLARIFGNILRCVGTAW